MMGENEQEQECSNATLEVLMLPWLAHGHLLPFLELAKRLSRTNIVVHFCSTPINIGFIKEAASSPYIKLVELHLPDVDLPPHLHSTKYLPPHLMPALKTAFDRAEPDFRDLLNRLRPDLLLYDFLMPWAPRAARETLGIPSVLFLATAASTNAFFCHHLIKVHHREEFPFAAPSLMHVRATMPDMVANGISDFDRFLQCIDLSSGFIAIRTFKEIESDRIDYLSSLVSKEVVPVGPLVPDSSTLGEGHDQSSSSRKVIMDFLCKKDNSSVLFASFGSEYFLSSSEVDEISKGLELSKVSFVLVIRFPNGREDQEKSGCVTERIVVHDDVDGLVLTGWAPQREILAHPSVGGFLSHCGWSSVIEAMRFGVPMVALPMQLDQPINAKLAVELGVAVEVEREVVAGNECSRRTSFKREDVAKGIRDVIVNEEGRGVRMKAKEIAEMMARKGNEETEMLVGKMAMLCTTKDQQRKKIKL